MARIQWVDDEDATGEIKQVYDAYLAGRPDRSRMPEILKCFSLRPDFLKDVMGFSGHVHFTDGHLVRRSKEMIATYVSGLNHCPY